MRTRTLPPFAPLADADPRGKANHSLPARATFRTCPRLCQISRVPAVVRRGSRAFAHRQRSPRRPDHRLWPISGILHQPGDLSPGPTGSMSVTKRARSNISTTTGCSCRTPAAPRSISSSISSSTAASCKPPSASCSTRRCAGWSPPSISGPSRSTVRRKHLSPERSCPEWPLFTPPPASTPRCRRCG